MLCFNSIFISFTAYDIAECIFVVLDMVSLFWLRLTDENYFVSEFVVRYIMTTFECNVGGLSISRAVSQAGYDFRNSIGTRGVRLRQLRRWDCEIQISRKVGFGATRI